MTDVISGAVFGAGLAASEMFRPDIIQAQMQLKDFRMFVTFLTASVGSFIAVYLFSKYGRYAYSPRASTEFGGFAFGGNILGGLLVGAGMSLTGACPGTLPVQLAAGLSSQIWALVGGALGALVYTKFHPGHLANTPATLPKYLGVSIRRLAVTLMVVFSTLVGVVMVIGAISSGTNPVLGGLLIAVGQVVAIGLTNKTIGMSASYEQLAKWVWNKWDHTKIPINWSSVLFGVGAVLGSTLYFTIFGYPGPYTPFASPFVNVVGGFALVFGARFAGGCPSGHGISGLANLGAASYVSVVAIFVGGIATSFCFK